MRGFADAELSEPVVVETPANIVMAAQIIEENILLRERIDNIHLMLEQRGIAGSDCVPGGGHRGYVVEHVAFRFFKRAEVGNNLEGSITTSPRRSTPGQTISVIIRIMRTMVCT